MNYESAEYEASTLQRFWAKVAQVGDCWEWTSPPTVYGYGQFNYKGSPVRAHRFAYEYMVGEIPEGLHLDHLCRNRLCVNPDHLEPVPCAVNVRRGNLGQNNAIKTHCPKGHPYTKENTYQGNRPGWRRCKKCTREVNRIIYFRKKNTEGK